jgi:predicted nucleic acid-binding Zn ribbon protein
MACVRVAAAFCQTLTCLLFLLDVPMPAGAHCIDCGRACSVYAVQQAVYDDEVATCDSCGGLVKPGEHCKAVLLS